MSEKNRALSKIFNILKSSIPSIVSSIIIILFYRNVRRFKSFPILILHSTSRAYPSRYLQSILASKSAAAKALATNCQHACRKSLEQCNNVANETIKERCAACLAHSPATCSALSVLVSVVWFYWCSGNGLISTWFVALPETMAHQVGVIKGLPSLHFRRALKKNLEGTSHNN